MSDVYIVSFARTPIGRFGGSLSKMSAPQLGGIAVREAISRSALKPEVIEEVIMGNVIQAGVGQNPAGQVAKLAGLPAETRKYTVNVVCASGMLALESAAREISLQEKDLVIAGGMESMSGSPLLIPPDFRWGVKHLLGKDSRIVDSMLNDGLTDAFDHDSMGHFADLTASKFHVSREAVDAFAAQSNERADHAWSDGSFSKEAIPVNNLQRDEGIRVSDVSALSKLRPAFSENGICTAGNSSQLSDGASALVLASERAVDQYNLKPVAKITGYNSYSMEPKDFVEAPIPCTRQLLEKQGKKINDFDLVEHNEAFASASVIVRDELGIENDRFNVFGGAVAIGHPIGNSGSRIVVTLLNALHQRHMKSGLATLCHGGGGAHSMTVELQ